MGKKVKKKIETTILSSNNTNILINKKNSKSICLNMIVKNEAHIIKETFDSISKYIDYWVISDTGSTDGTQEIIKNYFKEKNIPGELVEHEWKNFGYNRSKALECAYNKTDYIWIIDADDLIVGDFKFPEPMNLDEYMLTIGKDFVYKRTQIVNNRLKWRYRGILHEYIECIEKKNTSKGSLLGNYYLDSRRMGSRSSDPDKYKKDAELLSKAIENNDEPDLSMRYCFYAGQSYKDCNDYKNAIKYYKKRIEYGGWNEELFISWMEIGNAMVELKYPKKDIVESYLNGFKSLPKRSECLYFLAKYYYDNDLLVDALNSIKVAMKIKYDDKFLLFVKKHIYDYALKEILFLVYTKAYKANTVFPKFTKEEIDIEYDELYKFFLDNKDNIDIPTSVSKRIIAIYNNKKLPEVPQLKDWDFYPGLDSYGGDIGCFNDNSIEELVSITELYPDCVAFNT